MKRVSLIAGIASLAAVAAVLWSMPAAAGSASDLRATAITTHDAHDKWPSDRIRQNKVTNTNTADEPEDEPTSSLPEPGILALLALGAGGVGLAALARRRPRA